VPRGEIVLWVDSWVASTKALTQWDVLADYSRNSDNLPLAMDCLWRLHDWETLSAMLMQNQGQVRGYGCWLRVCVSVCLSACLSVYGACFLLEELACWQLHACLNQIGEFDAT
jgi:hypothetical protein